MVKFNPLILMLMVLFGMAKQAQASELLPEVKRYVEQRVSEFDQIPDSRKADLEALSEYVRRALSEGRSAELMFVCTHNSRRSHLAQTWAKIAAVHFGIEGVNTYSGGTEVTAFNPRAVGALQRAGLQLDAEHLQAENPTYRVGFQHGSVGEISFSKRYDDSPNPSSEFCAVMTCSDPDENCPAVRGCDARVAITYKDPKESDDTLMEELVYDERCQQISREMLYAMSRVGSGYR